MQIIAQCNKHLVEVKKKILKVNKCHLYGIKRHAEIRMITIIATLMGIKDAVVIEVIKIIIIPFYTSGLFRLTINFFNF